MLQTPKSCEEALTVQKASREAAGMGIHITPPLMLYKMCLNFTLCFNKPTLSTVWKASDKDSAVFLLLDFFIFAYCGD